MKIDSFTFLKSSSTLYRKNLGKCSEIFKNLLNSKENFFFDTLNEQYQKNLFLKKITLKKKFSLLLSKFLNILEHFPRFFL